jgi:predicted porin
MGGYFRLYFGVDGKLANGLIYGAKSEMRTQFAPAGGGTLANSSGNSTQSLWYTRRAYGYFGGDSFGIVRIGQGDGPLSLFTGGGISTGEAFSTGAWDGDACVFTAASCLAWAFLDVGNEYVSNKVTWVSPSWGGLQIGASFAPESVGLWANGDNNASAAGGGNARAGRSALSADNARPKNMFEVAARWQGNLGPVALDAMAGYLGSDTVKLANGVPNVAGTTGFKGLSVFDAGLSATIMGISAFGHISTGKMNGAATPQATLASGRKKDGIAWVIGAMYSTGPYTVGTSWYQFDHQGSNGGTGNRSEKGFAVGGQYTLVTGVDFFLEYLYGNIHQAGVNFVDGGAGGNGNNNNAKTNMVVASALFRW